MNDYIDFSVNPYVLKGYMCFSATPHAVNLMVENGFNPDNLFCKLSASNHILACYGIDNRNESDYVSVFTTDGEFKCHLTADSFLIYSFRKQSLYSQNRSLKDGILFITDGTMVSLNVREGYDMFYDFLDGKKKLMRHSVNTGNVLETIYDICEKDYHKKQENKAQVIVEKPKNEKRVERLLDIAENYANLSNDLELKKVNEIGKIAYTAITAVNQQDRKDRVAYQFDIIGCSDPSVFTVGSSIDIEDKSLKTVSGEITEVTLDEEDETALKLVVLFKRQVSIDTLPTQGWITLSISTVNRDVQLAAIDKLRNQEAPAQYLNNVFGLKKPSGFENKYLTVVEAKLRQKKYPPNDSQLDAIKKGINTKDVYLVMGPPGTGKTTVILEWVKYFVNVEHKRVLVSSQNNKAVDNVLARIAEEPDIDVIRVGSELKIQADVRPFMFENKIETLRTDITSKVKNNLNTVDQLNDYWAKVRNALLGYNDRLKSTMAQRSTLEHAVNSQLKPQYDEAKRLVLKNNELRDAIKQYANVYRENKNKIAEYNQDSFFKRIIHIFAKKKAQKAFEEAKENYYSSKNQLTQVNERYKQVHSQLLTSYNMIFQKEFSEYYVDFEPVYHASLKIPRMIPEEKNSLGFFDQLIDMKPNWLNVSEVNNYIALIEQENKRINLIGDVLGEWHDQVNDSQNYALDEVALQSVDLVGATCIGINSQKRFANLDFDVTIMDEAGQIQVHNALVPMSVSPKLIMLGDHKQIPPSADQELLDLCAENEVDTELLKKSLFEYMYESILPDENKAMLDTQYRMPAEIADILSKWFYNGRYYSPEFKKNQPSQYPQITDQPFLIVDTSRTKGHMETKVAGKGSYNALETKIIADIVKTISKNDESVLDELGIISAYKMQVKTIRNALSKMMSEARAKEIVATLDSFQGQERNVIIYSFTKSSRIPADKQRIGFLKELRRLNVAMSRCKKMLILVGDMDFLTSCKHPDEKEFSDFIKLVVESAKQGHGEMIDVAELNRRLGVNE